VSLGEGGAISLRTLCAELSEALGVSIEAVSDVTRLDAVDRYFAYAVGCHGGSALHTCRPRPLPAPDPRDSDEFAGHADPVGVVCAVDPDRIEAFRAAARTWSLQDQALRSATPLAAMARRRVDVAGNCLTYLVGGVQGRRTIVLLNAIGQGLVPWVPLIRLLLPHHRVVAWDLLTLTAGGRVATVPDQVDTVAAILDQEGIGHAHLLGWCAGAKIALEVTRVRPQAVASLFLLNGSFKHPGRPADLDSPYERALESVCAAVDRQPDRAATLRRLFTDTHQALQTAEAASPLSALDPALRACVVAPFADNGRMLVYARQHLDYWARALGGPDLPDGVPLAFVASLEDTVVSAAGIRSAAARFPGARLVELVGATHHRMYDRPDLVADMVHSFLTDPTYVGEPVA